MNEQNLEYNSLMSTYSSVLDRHEEIYGVTGGEKKNLKWIIMAIIAILVLVAVGLIIWKVVL